MADQLSIAQDSTSSELRALELCRDRDKYCPHCECVVPNATFYHHKQLFYDERSHTWSKVRLSLKTVQLVPELQDSTFVDTAESAVSDVMDQTMSQEEVLDLSTEQEMPREMHDLIPEGMHCIIRISVL